MITYLKTVQDFRVAIRNFKVGKGARGPVYWAANTSNELFIVATLSENQVTAEKLDFLHPSSASVQQLSLALWIGTSIHSSFEVAYPKMTHLIKFETLIKPP